MSLSRVTWIDGCLPPKRSALDKTESLPLCGVALDESHHHLSQRNASAETQKDLVKKLLAS